MSANSSLEPPRFARRAHAKSQASNSMRVRCQSSFDDISLAYPQMISHRAQVILRGNFSPNCEPHSTRAWVNKNPNVGAAHRWSRRPPNKQLHRSRNSGASFALAAW